MSAVVTDTHALIWYLFEPNKLSDKARVALRAAESEAELIYVPTICIVEIRYLIEKRVFSETVFAQLIESLLDPETAPTSVPLNIEITRYLQQVPKAKVPDMPDRIIAATALYLDLPLVTRDHQIQASGIQSVW